MNKKPKKKYVNPLLVQAVNLSTSFPEDWVITFALNNTASN